MLKKALGNALLLVAALGAAFGLGEVVVRMVYGDSVSLVPRYQTDYRYGAYTLRGIRPDTVFWHKSVDGSWKFVTNHRGFRSTRDFQYQKPVGTMRVLSLGDSHTQGYEVRQEATFSAVLERYLTSRGQKAEVINAGVSGFSTAEELAFLENEGVKYQPDIVVLGFYANDYVDNLKAGLFGLDATGRVVVRRYEHIPGIRIQNFIYAVPLTKWLGEHSYFYSLLFNTTWVHFKKQLAREAKQHASTSGGTQGTDNDAFEYAVALGETHTDREVALATALILRMQEFCKTRGIRLLVVDVPAPARAYGHRPSLTSAIVEKLEAAGVEILLSDVFLGPFHGAVEVHVPHGSRHISEFTHGIIGAELGRRVLAEPRVGVEPEAAAADHAIATPEVSSALK
jgi:hypothetical protein